MKVDTSRLKKGTSEVPAECQQLIDKLRTSTRQELAVELARIDSWTFGKSELYHWIDVLDIFDGILEEATRTLKGIEWLLACDVRHSGDKIRLLLSVLNFTTLLIEHSFSRHLYNSVEHLTALLSSANMHIVLGVLNLLYMFSKRSNFIPRLNSSKRNALLSRLTYIAESWGGKDHGYGLADCCSRSMRLPGNASTFYYEYYDSEGVLQYIDPQMLLEYGNISPGETAYLLCSGIHVALDVDQKMLIFTRIRLTLSFHKYQERLQFVLARLQALSVLVYSNSLQENIHNLLYPGFLEELVELLEMRQPFLVEIRAAALRTLTSIIHLDRNPHFPKKPGSRLNMIIDVTGASSYHGFLPTLVRTCIQYLTNPESDEQSRLFPLPLATALFSFLYHLASYDSGGEALVACGMMESLLRVINWPGSELEHITFVTRAVRVIDLITNIEMQSFQNHGGLNSFIGRLDMEVNLCRKEQPFEIEPHHDRPTAGDTAGTDDDDNMSEDSNTSDEIFALSTQPAYSDPYSDPKINLPLIEDESGSDGPAGRPTAPLTDKSGATRSCLPQRAALLKSMLNFLKKAIQDSAFSESIRHVMEGTLPSSLRHIISNAEYYGPSLFLLATDVVTVYVFQEPSLLFSLQDNGLTDVVLQALLKKDVPATREVLGSLPNVFSALCLNTRGLACFAKYSPFDKLFKVLLSPVYLTAMKRRRSSDPMGDTASNLGNAMDELMRHQPSLKTEATKSIIRLLEELVNMGTDPKYICWRATNKTETAITASTFSGSTRPATATAAHRSGPSSSRGGGGGGRGAGDSNVAAGGSSDEEDDDEEEASTSSHNQRCNVATNASASSKPPTHYTERTPIPLIDYIMNVMKFVDAILSNNSTDDHCREFVSQGGLKPLLKILSLPNLPVDCPITASAQAVAAVCKSILNLAHEPQVLQVGLEQLAYIVDQLKPLQSHWVRSRGSVLLRELANCPNISGAFSTAVYTPLLHGMSAVHGYVVMLVHVCRTGQFEIRNLSIQKWGQDNRFGRKLLYKLVQLYTALVWESTLLLALCTDDIIPDGCDFGKEDMDKLPNDLPTDGSAQSSSSSGQQRADITIPRAIDLLEALDENSMDVEVDPMDFPQNDQPEAASTAATTENKRRIVATPGQLKYIKSLLGASSRLGRALAELFGLLVKLCVSSPRRPQNIPTSHISLASIASKDIARVLSYILVDGLSHDQLPTSPIPKLKQTFLICSIGFTSPMLFDEKRYAYHLMLHKFVQEGGLAAFFEMFTFTMSCGYTISTESLAFIDQFPEGSGEFLDAWLLLLEKMVNSKAILESPHVITQKTRGTDHRVAQEFDAIVYLVNVHRKAFQAITKIWNVKPMKTYGPRMTESMLTIMKHIFKGEKIIREKYIKALAEKGAAAEKKGNSVPSATTTTTPRPSSSTAATLEDTASEVASRSARRSNFNVAQLQQLMDMGFTEEHCRQALYYTASMEHATEYLLSNFQVESTPATTQPTPTGPQIRRTITQTQTILDSDDDDDDDDDDEDDNEDDDDDAEDVEIDLTNDESIGQRPEPRCYAKKQRRGMVEIAHVLPNDPPLCELMLTHFSNGAVDTTLFLIDQVPETVYKGTELLAILFRRNTELWRYHLLENIGNQLKKGARYLCRQIKVLQAKSIEQLATQPDTDDEDMTNTTPRTNTPTQTAARPDDYDLFHGEVASKFNVRLHIFSLFFEGQYPDIRTPAVMALKGLRVIPELVGLLSDIEAMLTARCTETTPDTPTSSTTTGSPKWLAQMILLIDLFEKVAIYTQRKDEMHMVTSRIWKWYDVASGKWNAYSISNNKIINDAYWSGDSTVRVSVGRHRYTINFNCMSQVNEETGNHRPVILGLKCETTTSTSGAKGKQPPDYVPTLSSAFGGSEAADDWTSTNATAGSIAPTDPAVATTSTAATNRPAKRPRTQGGLHPFSVGLMAYNTPAIVSTCVRLMSPKILMDRDTLHALMRFCVRLTTKYENAEVFAHEGGVKLLLEMKQTCGYIGFSTLANLLIRHTLEEPKTLTMAMEKVISARTMTTIPPGYRELVFMLRRMSSAVSRDPEIFRQVATSMLRIDVTALRRGVFSEDNRLIMKSTAPAKRHVPIAEETENDEDDSTSVQVIHDLLQALVIPVASDPNVTSCPASNKDPRQQHHHHPALHHHHIEQISPVIGDSGGVVGVVVTAMAGSGSGGGNSGIITSAGDAPPGGNTDSSQFQHRRPLAEQDDDEEDDDDDDQNDAAAHATSATSASATATNRTTSSSKDKCLWNITCTKADNDKPLLPKSTILKALAEAVRSFASVGIIIAEYVYEPDPTTLVKKDPQPALAFILDHLLPITEANPDRECSNAARMLVAALSSATDSAVTQYTVVSEVKAAIGRALAWPEINEKHQQLQILTGLIPTMIENCPPDTPAQLKSSHQYSQYQPRRNDIFFTMVRKGLIADLAKITQNLDLSSPHTVTTINAVLKPLETLLRMTNQPGPSAKKKAAVAAAATASADEDVTMTEENATEQDGNDEDEEDGNDEDDDEDDDDEEEADDDDDDDDGDDDAPASATAPVTIPSRSHGGMVPVIPRLLARFTCGPGGTVRVNNPLQDAQNTIESADAPEESSAATLRLRTTVDSLEARVQAIGSSMEELMDHFRVHDPNESGFSGNGNGGNEMDQPSNIVMRRNVVNEMDVPSNIVMRNFNIEVTNEPLETSSESCDSESNGSENDEREMDDEDDNGGGGGGNVGEGDNADNIDIVDETSRQFMHRNDEEEDDDILMNRYSAGVGVGHPTAETEPSGATSEPSQGEDGSSGGSSSGGGDHHLVVSAQHHHSPATPLADPDEPRPSLVVSVRTLRANAAANAASQRQLRHHRRHYRNITLNSRNTTQITTTTITTTTTTTPTTQLLSAAELNPSVFLERLLGSPAQNMIGGSAGGGGGGGGSGASGGSGGGPSGAGLLNTSNSGGNNGDHVHVSHHRSGASGTISGGPSTSAASVVASLNQGNGGQNNGGGSGSTLSNGAATLFRDATRVVVVDNGFNSIFSNSEDSGSVDLVDQAGYLFGRSLAATLNSTPPPLHWWLEEAKVLGLESQSDVCLTVCNSLIPKLEAERNDEVAKSRTKKSKKTKDGESTKSQSQQTDPTADQSAASTVEAAASGTVDAANTAAEAAAEASATAAVDAAETAESNEDDDDEDQDDDDDDDDEEEEDDDDNNSLDDEVVADVMASADRLVATIRANASAIDDEHSNPDDDDDEEDDDEENPSEPGETAGPEFLMQLDDAESSASDSGSLPESILSLSTVPSPRDAAGADEEDSDHHMVDVSGPVQRPIVVTLPLIGISSTITNTIQANRSPSSGGSLTMSSSPVNRNATTDEAEEDDDEEAMSSISDLIMEESSSSTNESSDEDTSVQPTGLQNSQSDSDDSGSCVVVESTSSPRKPMVIDDEAANAPLPEDDDDEEVNAPTPGTLACHVNGLLKRIQTDQHKMRYATEANSTPVPPTIVIDDDDDDEDDDVQIVFSTLPERVPFRRPIYIDPEIIRIDSPDDDEVIIIEEPPNQDAETPMLGLSSDDDFFEQIPYALDSSSDEEDSDSDSRGEYSTSEDDDDDDDDETEAEVVAATGAASDAERDEDRETDMEGAVGGQIPTTALVLPPAAPPARGIDRNSSDQHLIMQIPIHQPTSSAESGSAPIVRVVDAAAASFSGPEIPDGVDPSFLAALPQEMREEVIAEHLRQQRIRQRTQQNAIQNEHASIAEVNPEFLAALPPNIQEEVLAQQRIEQQRQAAAAANPDDPVDTAAFFQNLQPSLRQAILTDMEDSQISALPPDLAAEAQNLRRDWETRNRQIMQEHINISQIDTTPTFSSVLRYRSRLPEPIFSTQNLHRMRWSNWNSVGQPSAAGGANQPDTGPSLMTTMERQGRPLLDHDSLASLLILLFIDEPKFNTLRLHRVIRNLSFHVPTRDWIIRALLSIIDKSNENTDGLIGAAAGSSSASQQIASRPQWLNIRLDAALGTRNNVFIIRRVQNHEPCSSNNVSRQYAISIHSQASQIICRHALDLLISLAKSFPVNFLPVKLPGDIVRSNDQPGPSSAYGRMKTDFWDILIRLETTAEQRKANPIDITSDTIPPPVIAADRYAMTFDESPFGQLVSMLSYSIVKKSSQLTDKLLRLLSFISNGLPECRDASDAGTAATADKTKSTSSSEPIYDESCLPESIEHLRLAIDVLTSKSCSEDGLEDATSLLLNLSQCSNTTRSIIILLLINGATFLAVTVQSQIKELMTDLRALNRTGRPAAAAGSSQSTPHTTIDPQHSSASSSASSKSKGILQDRFTKETVVITASSKQKQTCELQLPSMVPLISKTSSQSFFLRILKVIIQIREAVREALAKETTAEPSSDAKTPADGKTSETPARHKIILNQGELAPLSETLLLDELWDTLSDCLVELEDTADHHAVLVLQPAVEAFFLVHASSQSKATVTQPSYRPETVDEAAEHEPLHGAPSPVDHETGSSVIYIDTDDDDDDDTGDAPNDSHNNIEITHDPRPRAQRGRHAMSRPARGSRGARSGSSSAGSSSAASTATTAATAGAPASTSTTLPPLTLDQKKFLQFAEKHRTVLNQILRQSTGHLSDGPFAVLVDHTRILDFDVKRRYFRTELERMDEGIRREELAVHVRRVTVFEDSFRELYRRNPEEWKNRFYIVFEDEEGQDAGGLLREWYVIISREIFNPMYALFTVSPGDRVTYMINPSSHANPNHLFYFKFVGRVIAKAIYDNKLLECYFTRSFYKHILGIEVNRQDMESEDYEFYKGLVFLMENHISELGYDQTFSLEVQEFGVTEVRDLITDGRNVVVNESNKNFYVHLVCQLKMSGSIKQQLNAFLEGFYDIIPKRLISIFNEQELELLISGLPNVDIEDLKANTEYHKYQANSIQIQWFWRALRSFDQADRAKFLQFVTGTSKVPLQGFAALEGMNGTQKFQIHRDDRSTERLPSAHTCFNQLDLPVYKTYDKLRSSLLKAIHECSEGFGFA